MEAIVAALLFVDVVCLWKALNFKRSAAEALDSHHYFHHKAMDASAIGASLRYEQDKFELAREYQHKATSLRHGYFVCLGFSLLASLAALLLCL